MGKIIFDFGNITILMYLLIFLLCAIFFPFVKRNGLFGIRTNRTLSSDKVWKRVHKKAGNLTWPFLPLFIGMLFIQNYAVKILLSTLVTFIILALYIVIEMIVSGTIEKEREKQEQEELLEKIKKESA